MAGSLSHITDDATGEFTIDLVNNGGDMIEALEECHQIIAYLLRYTTDATEILRRACNDMSFPEVDHIPVIQPEMHGASSIFKEPNQ